MELLLSQIELKYAALRVSDRTRQAALVASIAARGQKEPVLVVAAPETPERYVLIDGYRRVAALRELARDHALAVGLELGETEALLVAHRLARAERKSALEEGWLLHELVERHGLAPSELAARLERSGSWVSRRLGLVAVLPEVVQDAVREGRLTPHAAQKVLLPLARANREACERLVARLGRERRSVRELERLYRAWKQADREGRERIVEHPLLFLRAEEACTGAGAVLGELVSLIVRDLEATAALCERARHRLGQASAHALSPLEQRRVRRSFRRTRASFDMLREELDPERSDARP